MTDVDHRRAVRFFWTVLICATCASIAGNAVHATLHATTAPPVVAAMVATAPPLVLLASTEGVSLLLRARRERTATHSCALAMTVLLAVCAFVLSFDALRDLAIRSGIRAQLAWLWPVAVDVTIAQGTIALLALSRPRHVASARRHFSEPSDDDRRAAINAHPRPDENGSRTTEAGHGHAGAAVALIQDKVTKKSAELVEAVLQRYANGERIGTIAAALDVHHSTVRRLLAAQRQRGITTSRSPTLR